MEIKTSPIIQDPKLLQTCREIAKKLVRTYFKNDYGQPFEMVNSQADIFLLIYLKLFPRNVLLTYTQFGKTDIVSMALIVRTQTYKEKFTIVAGKKQKGMLIMNRVMQHLFDHKRFYSKLEIDKEMPLERLKRDRSRESVTWLGGGGIRVLTANTSNIKQTEEALIGEGSQNIIEEEAPFIPDSSQAMIMRMMMGHKSSFLVKMGNAFGRNHFHNSAMSDKYAKIVVDYFQGIDEGRITEEQIDEVRDLPFFNELYALKFPDSQTYTFDGYSQLIDDSLLMRAFITEGEAIEQNLMEGKVRLGGDIGGGGDKSVYVLRWNKVMKIHSSNRLHDTMQQVPIIEDIMNEYKISAEDVSLDYGGIGQGVSDRLIEKGVEINPVMFGSSPPDDMKEKFSNARAFMYYELKKWILNGGRIIKDDGFLELISVNYKSDSERKFKIQPKEDLKKVMKKLGIKGTSPDTGDAAALTFADLSKIVTEEDFGFV